MIVLISLHNQLKLQAVVWRYSVKKLFLKISQNWQENTRARVSFLIKLQASSLFPNFIELNCNLVIQQYRCWNKVIHQVNRKWSAASFNKFYSKLWDGFCLNTGKRLFAVKTNRKTLVSLNRWWEFLKQPSV